MERSRKEEIVSELESVLGGAGIVIVARHEGLTVAEATELRRSVRDAGASFRVVKNRLVLRALQHAGMEAITEMFRGPSAIATATDPVAGARVTVDYARKNSKLVIVGGTMAGRPLDADGVRTIAQLPPLDELRARLIMLINTPATRVAGVLQEPGSRIARLLDSRQVAE